MNKKYPIDVNEELFCNVEVFGQPMLFTDLRCDRNTLPKGAYLYEVQYDEESGELCAIAESIIVNHWGTLITNRPLKLETRSPKAKPILSISEEDWNYLDTQSTLKEYMEKYL